MKTDDQWFEPGDKVMRVDNSNLPTTHFGDGSTDAPFGKVFCVEHCQERLHFNSVTLIGVCGCFLAKNFRRVSEIQLCVRASKRIPAPVKVEKQEV